MDENFLKNFLVIYYSSISAQEQMDVSPEEKKKGMESRFSWMKNVDKGLVEGERPLVNGMRYIQDDASQSKMNLNGYSILQAENWQDLEELVKGKPHFIIPDARIKVFEMISMM